MNKLTVFANDALELSTRFLIWPESCILQDLIQMRVMRIFLNHQFLFVVVAILEKCDANSCTDVVQNLSHWAERTPTAPEAPPLINYFSLQVPTGTAQIAFQREFVVVSKGSTRPYAGSSDLNGSIAVVVRNPKTGRTGIAHIDSRTKVKSLSKGVEIIREGQDQLQIFLFGGRDNIDSRSKYEEIKNFFASIGLSITGEDVFSDSRPSQVLIDVRTGHISKDFPLTYFENRRDPNLFSEFNRNAKPDSLPLKLTIDEKTNNPFF